MADFETRWTNALQRFKSPWGNSPTTARILITTAFRNSTFIYGTTGPNALQNKGTGNPVARAASILATRATSNQTNKLFGRTFLIYDPGPRTEQYIARGHQMMDMYYGNGGGIFRLRDPVIAQFLHLVMEFDERDVAFDPHMSGRDAFMKAFKTRIDGWVDQPCTDAAYGQSATKEMSKIIREGIRRFGGKIIFEGKAVFGAGIFHWGPARDTDVEAQQLFSHFNRPKTPYARFGKGSLEFQWGGRATTPTRAHFLTNWTFDESRRVHGIANRKYPSNANAKWEDYLRRILSNCHGLRPIWNRFDDFPVGFLGPTDLELLQSREKQTAFAIKRLATMLHVIHKLG